MRALLAAAILASAHRPFAMANAAVTVDMAGGTARQWGRVTLNVSGVYLACARRQPML